MELHKFEWVGSDWENDSFLINVREYQMGNK